MEVREAFLHHGGKEFHYIPCLNDTHPWIGALSRITQQHLQGWPTTVAGADAQEDARKHALAGGAPKGVARWHTDWQCIPAAAPRHGRRAAALNAFCYYFYSL